MPRRPSHSTLAHLLLLAVVFVWGATFVLVKDALADASPLLFNLLRMTLAAIALVIVNHRQLRHITRRTLISGAVVGLFLAAGYQFQTAGLALTTPAKSAFITGLVVVFVPLFTVFPALRPAGTHAPRWTAALGALFAFAGLVLLTTPAGTPFRELFRTIGLGDLLTLAELLSSPAPLPTHPA
jgi:drug/metabolite transporter (DMT)-like permease